MGQKAIIVLGMHRSGTSALAGILNLLGVDLGPDLLPAAPDNPKGFWEHKAILDVHESLLRALDLSWDLPASFTLDWLSDDRIESFRRRLTEIVRRDFGASELWGLKDPRMCRLLPLWHSVFAEIECSPFFIHVIRNPVEVAASLERRDSFSLRKSVLLWLMHVLEAELHSKGFPRAFITHDQLMENWRGTMERVGRVLDITWPRAIDEAKSEIDQFLEAKLKHHNVESNELGGHADIPDYVMKTYEALLKATVTADRESPVDLSSCKAQFEESIRFFPGVTLIHELRLYKNEIGSLMAHISGKDAEIAKLHSDLAQRDARILEQEDSLSQKNVQIEELSSAISEKFLGLRKATDELAVQSSRLNELDRKLSETTLAFHTVIATKSWRWTAGFRRLQHLVATFRTNAKRFPALVSKGIAVLKHEGLTAFCEKSLRKLKRIHLFSEDDSHVASWRSHTQKTLYDRWIEEHEPANEPENKASIAHFAFKPKMSVVVPVFNTDRRWLDECIRSVLSQQYDNWELLLSDDGSTRLETLDCLKSWSFKDSRIIVSYGQSNQGISAASNRALKMASGEFIALLDHDDLLSADALYEAVKLLNEHPKTDIIYSDEDKVVEDQDGGNFRFDPHFKSEWDPQLLFAGMYIGHLTIYRKSLLDKAGGFRPEYDFAQDYDLALRSTELTDRIMHIPRILYHWRAIPDSGASGGKPYARKSNLNALKSAVSRRKYDAQVLEYPFANRVKFNLREFPLVSIIVPTDDKTLASNCISFLLRRTAYPNIEVIPVTNSELARSLNQCYPSEGRVRPLSFDKPFNFSLKCNEGAAFARGDYLLFLNDDIEPIEPKWLDDMMEVFGRGNVGGVSPKLYYEDDTIQYAGMVTGVRGLLGTPYHQLQKDSLDGFGRIQQPRLTSVLTGACLLIPKSIFRAVDGFDAVNTPIMDSDVDFSFKIREQGYDLVYQPFASLRHKGHASIWTMDDRRSEVRKKRKARLYCFKKWGDLLTRDPYFTDNMRYLDYETDFKAMGTRQETLPISARNILIVSHELSLTGAPIIAYDLARKFRNEGYFVTVMCPFDGPLRQKYVDENIPVIIDGTLAHYRSPHPHTADLMGHFDMILANTVLMWRSVLVAHEYDVPVLWFVHESSFGLRLASKDREIWKAFKMADDVLLYGKATEEIYKPFVRPGQLKRVVLGTEPLPNHKPSSRKDGKFSVVHVGSIEPRKGQDVLIESVLRLPDRYRKDIVVSFVGKTIDESYFSDIRRFVSKEPNIKFLGLMPREDIGALMRDADVLISSSREETGPLVVLEAMSAGKAIISTNVGSVEEMIKDGEHGFIIRTDDPEVLSERIMHLYDNRQEIRRLGENARSRFFGHFTLEHMAKEVLSLIEMRLNASAEEA